MGIGGNDAGLVEAVFECFVAVLAAELHFGRGDRERPEQAGVSGGHRAVFETGTVKVGQADEEVVAGGAWNPWAPDGHAVFEVEAMGEVVVGDHCEQFGETLIPHGC